MPRSTEAAAKLRAQMRRDYILYVGMRAAFKNFRGLLQAMHDAKVEDSVDQLFGLVFDVAELFLDLAGQTISGGNVSVNFSDGTKVTFVALNHPLTSSDFS